MATDQQPPPRPPQAPTMPRRFEISARQWIGVLLLLVVPILALVGVFGERQGRATVQSADVELHVEWPTRTRHELINAITVVARNVSGRTLDTLTVTFDSAYLAGFSGVAVTPGATQAWEVELVAIRPGEARRVLVEIDAQRHGRRTGPVIATSGGSDTARVVIDTFIFP